MKVNVSLMPRAGRVAPYLAAGYWLLAAVGVVAVVLLLGRIYMLRTSELPEARTHAERLAEVPREAASDIELPSMEQLIALKSRIGAINGLAGQAGWPLPLLLSRIEGRLPDDVYLVRLAVKQGSGDVSLTAEAKSAEVLAKLMAALEESGEYTQVLLTRQSQRSERRAKIVQFELRLKERP